MIKRKKNNITLKKVLYHINVLYARYIESILYRNWFNPLVTIYINFRSFPIKQAMKMPIIVYGWPKIFSLVGSMECVDKCYFGMIELNRTIDGAPNHPGLGTAINNNGKIIFHGKCYIHTSNKINVANGATLEIGENSKISMYVNITAHVRIKIGNNCNIAHRSQILDSNFHYIINFNNNTVNKYANPIEIGDYCWICNNSIINSGTYLPNKIIVASNSIVNKDMKEIPEESIIGGQPAKLLCTGRRRVMNKNFEKEIMRWFMVHPDVNIYKLERDIEHSICDVDSV